jgi:hypothetical protein
MENYIEQFSEAREYLVETIEPTILAYLCDVWDPMTKFVVIRELNKIIKNDLVTKFPDIENRFLPQFNYRMLDEVMEVELSIQTYYNPQPNLKYLGAASLGAVLYDLYYHDIFDGKDDPYFIARYGHLYENYMSGSKTAEAEYYLGAATPLAVAYGIALEDGIVIQ